MESSGLEPETFSMPLRCTTNCAMAPFTSPAGDKPAVSLSHTTSAGLSGRQPLRGTRSYRFSRGAVQVEIPAVEAGRPGLQSLVATSAIPR